MRVRGFVCAVIAGLLGLAATVGGAAACMMCDASLHCVVTMPGAKFCVEGPLTCGMAVPCVVIGQRTPDGSEEGLSTFTLFDADQAPGTAVEPDAGPIELGEGARRGAPGIAGSGAGRGALVETMLAHGRDFAAMFVDTGGGGFAIRRTEAGGDARIEVFEVVGGLPRRTLADATLGARDRLVATVTVEGRERVLLVQAAKLTGSARIAEIARLRRSLRAAGRTLPSRAQPLLELRAM